jgi:stringent starvation protein A
MGLIPNRRSVMTLFNSPKCAHCHRVRMVLSEKGVTYETMDLDMENLPEELGEYNPYRALPTLVDRDLSLYDVRVITEYLDERFPHPPLMPVDPVQRAQARLALYRLEMDWYPLLDDVIRGGEKKQARARKLLREGVTEANELFAAKPYFLSDEYSLLDCAVAPILWRLPHYGVEVPAEAKAVNAYQKRIFARASFRQSLVPGERDMRPGN